MLFDAMRSLGEIYRQFHIDIVKIRSAHGYRLSKITLEVVAKKTFFGIPVFFSEKDKLTSQSAVKRKKPIHAPLKIFAFLFHLPTWVAFCLQFGRGFCRK
jgi:hypothetical protein